jgi:GMP synthase (glutamine-hydrolysing)
VPTTLALRHVPFEDLGTLAPLLARRGHAVDYVEVPTTSLPRIDPLAPDLLVVLGGPIGVYETDAYPFLETPEGRASCLRHLAGVAVLHWHGDTFDLPEGAVPLGSTPVCRNQAFSWGKAALGLQFHAEAAGVALEGWFVGHAAEIAATAGISVQQLRADTARWSAAVTASGSACFADWLTVQGL